MNGWWQGLPGGLSPGQCSRPLLNTTLLSRKSKNVLKLHSTGASVIWVTSQNDDSTARATETYIMMHDVPERRGVYGWLPLCCRAPVELRRCRLLTCPSPSSPESITASSRSISRHSTSESPFVTHVPPSHPPEMKSTNTETLAAGHLCLGEKLCVQSCRVKNKNTRARD